MEEADIVGAEESKETKAEVALEMEVVKVRIGGKTERLKV